LTGNGEIVSVLAVDALGRVSPLTSDWRTQSIPPSGVSSLEIRDLKPGLYWLRIQTKEGVTVKKLVKK
jgi:hypothetical protein